MRYLVQRWISLLICLVFLLGVYSSFAWLVQAAGSGNMYPTGAIGFRGNLQWLNLFYGNNFLRRRTLLKVYAEAGEVVLLGSSAVGIDNGDIRVYNPGQITGRIGDEVIPAFPDFSCETQRGATANPNQGRITSRTQELAGPDTITDAVSAAPGLAVPNGYVPCFYPVPVSGIYNIVFFGPKGGNSNDFTDPTGEVDLTSPQNFDATQDTSVAAWDVTVRSALTSTTNITGRLFANYLALYMGGNPRPISSTLYGLTTEGYIYRTDLRGLDPNAFIILANNVGFLDSDGNPLYHDVVAEQTGSLLDQNQLTDLLGGVSLAPPTHLLFFEPPSAAAIQANGISLNPVEPVADPFSFVGNLGGNTSSIGGGGIFTYTSNVSGTVEIAISQGSLTSPLRILRHSGPTGTQTVLWDGLDEVGSPLTTGTYSATMTVRATEYHFVLLDIENSLSGGPQYTLLNPPGGVCPSFNQGLPNCSIGFYDDRGYTSTTGISVGTPGAVLSGTNPPPLDHSDPFNGFDTASNQRRFGDGSTTGFGDKKGLDLWTFVPTEPKITTLNIIALNLAIGKTDGGISTTLEGVVTYSLTYSNAGPADATGVTITETVPVHTTFNAQASSPTIWICPDGSVAGTVCTFVVGNVLAGNSGSINFGLTVNSSLPAGVSTLTNTAIIADDGAHGPEPTHDNSASDTTPIIDPPPPTPPTPTPTYPHPCC